MPSGGVTPGGQVQVASVTLTSAQVLAIHTTPVEIVPAPGAGFALCPIGVFLNYTYVTTPYNSTAGHLYLYWGGTAAAIGQLASATGFWDQSNSTAGDFTGSISSGSQNISGIANKNITLGEDTANPTTGDGTVTVTIAYLVIPVS